MDLNQKRKFNMTGHFESNMNQINTVLWADAEFDDLKIDYDSVKIRIEESNGLTKLITCHGYIGFESIGLWDEIVISSATMHKKHELIDRSKSAISMRLGNIDSGSNARNIREWGMLQITFIDGAELNIVMTQISVSAVS
ncbi:MAG: hypothetical protein V7784_12955 [Oceanospirillaceae bacterium]